MISIKYPLLIMLMLTCFFSTANAEYMEVTLLGTGTPQPSIERFGPATVIKVKGRYFIFDSGRGITIRLAQAGIDLAKVEHVFLTHLHSDHLGGLSDLWLTSWIWQRPTNLRLVGPIGTAVLADNLTSAYRADFNYRTKNTQLNTDTFDIVSQEIMAEGIVYDHDGIKISAFLVDHHPVEPAYGYRIDSGEQSVVISGDTTYSKNLIKQAKGVDLLIHEIAAAEATLLEQNSRLRKILSYHTTPEQAGQLLSLIQPKAAVYNHVLLFGVEEQTVLQTTRSVFRGELRMGYDLMKIGVGKKVTFE